MYHRNASGLYNHFYPQLPVICYVVLDTRSFGGHYTSNARDPCYSGISSLVYEPGLFKDC